MQVEIVEAITVTVAALSFIVAFISLWNASKKDATDNTKEFAEVNTKNETQFATVNAKLDAMGDSLNELRSDLKDASSAVSHAQRTADQALESAKSAHKRLDRAGIDTRND